MPARAPDPFAYAILRIVPRVERGEQLNAGVVLLCRQRDFLAVRAELDPGRLRALSPDAPLAELEDRLRTLERIAAGEESCGQIARLPISERFGWLVAPSSTMVQPSEVHTGMTDDPPDALNSLFARLVALSRRSTDPSAGSG
jgi:DUF3037 family protein